eukprot:TRINITY_DN31379_c0_g1_i1.p1 TRINITY_DN31379_c0_g1~~TRINITY_DN31379_c0_g1_i1.p1  ORF type:complete len:487 (+),score=59.34 TRINITY_DN31379_c0_g1_i1:85-1461(+)
MPGPPPDEVMELFRDLSDICLKGCIPVTINSIDSLRERMQQLVDGTTNWVEDQRLFHPTPGVLTYMQAAQSFKSLDLVPSAEGKTYTADTWGYISGAVELKDSLYRLEQASQTCTMDQALYGYTNIFWRISRWVFNVINMKEREDIISFFENDDHPTTDITYNSIRKLFSLPEDSMLLQHPCISAMENNPNLLSNSYLTPLIVGGVLGPKPPLPDPTETPPPALPPTQSAPMPHLQVNNTMGLQPLPLSKKQRKKQKKNNKTNEQKQIHQARMQNKKNQKAEQKAKRDLAAERLVLKGNKPGTIEAHKLRLQMEKMLTELKAKNLELKNHAHSIGGRKIARNDSDYVAHRTAYTDEVNSRLCGLGVNQLKKVCSKLAETDPYMSRQAEDREWRSSYSNKSDINPDSFTDNRESDNRNWQSRTYPKEEDIKSDATASPPLGYRKNSPQKALPMMRPVDI